MVKSTFNLIVAACENSGIGICGNLPWRLKLVFKSSKMYSNIYSYV